MITELLSLCGEVIGVNTDTVPANKPWGKFEEVPLGAGGFEHIVRPYAHAVENNGKLIHERNVHITLCIFNDLGGLRHFILGLTLSPHKQYAPAIGGDFITAPEISQMFGELIGLWCAQTWLEMGAPAICNMIEAGEEAGILDTILLRLSTYAEKSEKIKGQIKKYYCFRKYR